MHVTGRFIVRSLALVVLGGLVGFGGVVGCNSEPKDPFHDTLMGPQKYSEYVPSTATPVASGTGMLTYTATQDGTLYLLDTSAMSTIEGVQKPKVLVTGFVRNGDTVEVVPDEKRVRLKGRKGLMIKGMDPSHTHELRFDPGEKPKKG
jgi:hypothetical protein